MSLKLFILSLLIFMLFVNGCAADARFTHKQFRRTESDTSTKYYEGQKITGISSFYGKKFHGRLTASGEVFDMYAFTAAHRDLPFGTILNVKNLDYPAKSVQVKVNDRGPFVKNRILDLSYTAAKALNIISTGTAKVEITIIKLGQ